MPFLKQARWFRRRSIRFWIISVAALYLIVLLWTTTKLEPGSAVTDVNVESSNPSRDIVLVLIMDSVVDQQKHEARKKSILQTWGVNRTFGQTAYIFRFVKVIHKEDLHETRAFSAELKRAELEYGERLSWVLKCDDITFVIVEHLHRYLQQLTHTYGEKEPVLAGNLLSAPKDVWFVSGGAGFVLNKATRLGLVNSDCLEEMCRKTNKERPWWAGSLDIALTQCARQTFGKRLRLVDAVEMVRVSNGPSGSYFNVFDPVRMVRGKLDPWYIEYKRRVKGAREDLVIAEQCCSQHPVTFHYVESQSCMFFHKLVHTPYAKTDLRTAIAASWPKHVGGHASHPKGEGEVARLADLFHNISVAA